MSSEIRTATAQEAKRLWSAVAEEHIFADERAFLAHLERAPWRLRVASRGDAALLGGWRESRGVLAMRATWCTERRVTDFATDALALASEHGYVAVLSPLVPVSLVRGYRSAGMRTLPPIVAIQGRPQLRLSADPPTGATIREGLSGDLGAIARVEADSFDEFWRYDFAELSQLLGVERMAVAQTDDGEVIGYTLTTVSRGEATLSRLATAERVRRRGVGRALLAESIEWAARSGAATYSLCTQEDNVAGRRLYAAAGLTELAERYVFAWGDAAREVEREGREP